MTARRRVTPAMRRLLAELDENARTGHADGGWYIRRCSQSGRTAASLRSLGLTEVDEHDYSSMQQDHHVITEAGRLWLADHPTRSDTR